MIIKCWVLPLLIGIVAAIALISILWNNPTVKTYFTDINYEGFTQGKSSNLGNHDIKVWKPIPYNQNETIDIPEHEYIERKIKCDAKNLDNMNLKITTMDSPLYTGDNKGIPIYNYYPKVKLD